MNNFEKLRQASTSEVLAVIAVILDDIGNKLDRLTETPGQVKDVPVKEVPEIEQAPEVPITVAEMPAPEQAEGHTRDDIRSAVRELTRRGRSAEGKQCVKVNGYTAIKDIRDEDVERIYAELSKLLEEQ